MTNKSKGLIPDEIDIKIWHSNGGGMMYRTDTLHPSHEMHPYNQVKNMGYKPEDYGLNHPYEEMYKDKSRNEIIAELEELKNEHFHMMRILS